MRSLSALRGQRPRPTIRLKLTLWYGGMFLIAGALLLSLTYVLAREGFQPAPEKVRAIVAERLHIPVSRLEFRPPHGPGPDPGPTVLGVNVGRLTCCWPFGFGRFFVEAAAG